MESWTSAESVPFTSVNCVLYAFIWMCLLFIYYSSTFHYSLLSEHSLPNSWREDYNGK